MTRAATLATTASGWPRLCARSSRRSVQKPRLAAEWFWPQQLDVVRSVGGPASIAPHSVFQAEAFGEFSQDQLRGLDIIAEVLSQPLNPRGEEFSLTGILFAPNDGQKLPNLDRVRVGSQRHK